MSEHYSSLVVVFKENISEEYAQALISAIRLFDGVVSVTPNVADPGFYIAMERARIDLVNKLYDVLNPSHTLSKT